MSRRRRRVLLWTLGIVCVLGALYSVAGIQMAGSFSVADPERREHWEAVWMIYHAGLALCVAGALSCAVALFRARRRATPSIRIR